MSSPINKLRIMGGVSYIKPELTKLAVRANEGNIVIGGVPKLQGKLGAEWDINAASGIVTLAANATAVFKQYLDQANKLSIPGYTLFDVGARYSSKISSHPLTAQFAVNNVTNKAY